MSSATAEKILVVDDNEASGYVKERLLSSAGFEVTRVGSGEDALLSMPKVLPDLVLLDVRLPGIDGFEVCRRLRVDPATASIAVVHVSATYYAANDQVKGLEGGADSYMVAPVDPAVLIATVRSAIKLRRIERQLKQSQEQLAQALTAASMVAWDWDVDANVISYVGDTNDVLRRTYPQGRALADDLWNEVHVEDREVVEATLRHAVANSNNFVLQFRPAAGQAKALQWIEVHGRANTDPVTLKRRMSGVAMNITTRKQAELQLADEAKRKEIFLSSLSHELRNPIAALRSATGLIRRRNPSGSEMELIMENMDRQAKLLSRLVDDLLDISRLDHDRLSLRKQPVELATVLDMAMDTVGSLIKERGHQLISSVPTHGVLLYADPIRLSQVFTNVLANSAKYTPTGGRIELTVQRKPGSVEITIRDNGIGIEPADLPRVFELFYQADATHGKVHDGLGIGLQLVKRLVELHDGNVVAYSDGRAKGTQVTVTLPIADEDVEIKLPEPTH